MKNTTETVAALQIVAAVGEAIRDLGRVPSGHLYAQLMARLSLAEYNQIIGMLKHAKLIDEKSHELIWIGPAK